MWRAASGGTAEQQCGRSVMAQIRRCSGMSPAAISEEFLACDGGTGVARKEKNYFCDFGGLNEIRDGLRARDETFHGGCDVFAKLALGHDPTGRDGVDANAARPEFASERAREAEHAAFGGDVSGH